jgi:hypothetical protein
MSRRLFVFISLLCCCSAAHAQNDNASLLLQSPHGQSVKLIWFFKVWSPAMTSFDIKRRDGISKDWVKLNKIPIVPYLSAKKDFSAVAPEKSDIENIKALTLKYLASHKIEETDSAAFHRKMLTESHYLQHFFDLVMQDYDMALIGGFGYIDRSVSKKMDYEYGLFIHGSDSCLAKSTWNYGETPDLNVVTDIATKSTHKKRGIQIFWTVDVKKTKAAYVHGFNIYRDGIRLNLDPVMQASNAEQTEYIWFDSTANPDMPTQYGIGSESFLDIEGVIRSYTYNPEDHPTDFKKAEVTGIVSLGYYFKEGLQLTWDFPKEYERFLKGFYIEKNNLPGGFKSVSPLLEPGTRMFIDKTPSPAGSYVGFRVNAVYLDRTVAKGADHAYSYFPITEPPAPQNVKATVSGGSGTYFVDFTWDAPMRGDTLTTNYRLHVVDGVTGRLNPLTKLSPIKTNKYRYELKDPAVVNKFCVSALNASGAESNLSDTVTVMISNVFLPRPQISKIESGNDGTLLEWQYPEISELKGFRIYRNKQLVADENAVGKNARAYSFPVLGSDAAYEFSIQAVGVHDNLSDFSDVSSVKLPAKGKRK